MLTGQELNWWRLEPWFHRPCMPKSCWRTCKKMVCCPGSFWILCTLNGSTTKIGGLDLRLLPNRTSSQPTIAAVHTTYPAGRCIRAWPCISEKTTHVSKVRRKIFVTLHLQPNNYAVYTYDFIGVQEDEFRESIVQDPCGGIFGCYRLRNLPTHCYKSVDYLVPVVQWTWTIAGRRRA